MIFAFTGAGISKESGIDTFQERPGIRDCLTRSYAMCFPEEYKQVMRDFVDALSNKEPNDAHIALAEYDIPVMTMNVDTLHEQAGTKTIVKMHGRIPTEEELPYCDKLYNTPVLYGDPAPAYQEAYEMLDYMTQGDILLVIGASQYTTVSTMIRLNAMSRGATIVEIQDSASIKVRKFLEENKDKIKSFEERKRNFDALDWRE